MKLRGLVAVLRGVASAAFCCVLSFAAVVGVGRMRGSPRDAGRHESAARWQRSVAVPTSTGAVAPKAGATPGMTRLDTTRLVAAYQNLPLGFEANQGQTDSQVRFLSRGSGYKLLLTPREAILLLSEGIGNAEVFEGKAGVRGRTDLLNLDRTRGVPSSFGKNRSAVVRMQLVGSNP